jgi:hypothetical protein
LWEEILMATVDIPDDLWEFIEEHARRKGRDPAELITKVVDDYRTRETTNRSKNLALKGYGLPPEERKQGPR